MEMMIVRKRINLDVLWFVGCFFIISIISIYCAKIYTSSDAGNLVVKQFIWYLVGIAACFGIVKVGNKNIYRYTWLLYWSGVIALVFLLLFGKEINGSKCWFVVPGIGSIQPSEFMKLFIMFALSSLICDFKCESEVSFKKELFLLIKSLFVVLIPSILTFLQPDTGAVIIYFVIFIVAMFITGINVRWFLFALLIGILICSLVGGVYFMDEELFVRVFGTSFYYRIERIFMWSDGIGLQLENAISAIGSSGMVGYGFNKVPIYFPEASTDFIFAVYASCFGFIGVCLLLGIILGFDYYILLLLKKKRNTQSKYILSGILGMLLFQQIQNIGMTIGLLPITGITLPFISYGGSSLISYMIIVGLIINIASEKKTEY